MVLVLSNEEVAEALSMADCMSALEDSYLELSRGRAVNQLRYDTTMPVPERPERKAWYEFKTMAGILPKEGVAALRMSSTLNHRPVRYGVERSERLYLAPGDTTVGLVQLFSTDTGEPLAFMPDGVVQGMRVGGTYGLAIKYLARHDASALGILGSGHQARFQLIAAAVVRELRDIKVYSPNIDHRRRFAEEMTELIGINVEAVDSADEAAGDVDILISATNAKAPLVTGEMVRPGMHVAAVQNELSGEALDKADLIVSHSSRRFLVYEGGPGNGQYGREVSPTDNTFAGHGTLQIEALISRTATGRTSPEQVTMFRSGSGMGLQFAAVGACVYRNARERGIGREIPTDWFVQTLPT